LEYNFELKQGKTWQLEVTFQTEEDGVKEPVVITDYTFRGKVKKNPSSSSVASITGTISDAANGVVLISMSASVTAAISASTKSFDEVIQYYYDVEAVAPDGTVTELLNGIIDFKPEVTT